MLFLYRGFNDIPLPDPPVYPVHYPSFLLQEDIRPSSIKLPSLSNNLLRHSRQNQTAENTVVLHDLSSLSSSFPSSSSSSSLHQVGGQPSGIRSEAGFSQQSSVSSLASSLISVPSVSLSQKDDDETPGLRVIFHDTNSVAFFPLPCTSNLEVQTQYDNQSYLLVTFEVISESTRTYELLVKGIPPAEAGERFVTISIKVDNDACNIEGRIDGCDGIWKAIPTSTLMSV